MGRMVADEPLLWCTLTPFSERAQEGEPMTLDRLVALADEKSLVRLGLSLMELVAHAEGRTLWH